MLAAAEEREMGFLDSLVGRQKRGLVQTMTTAGRVTGKQLRRGQFLAALPGLYFTRVGIAQSVDSARKVGILLGSLSGRIYLNAFHEGLSKLGWTDGRNIVVTPYWGEGDSSIMQAHAVELVKSRPDVIVVQSATALRAVIKATADIPIVFFVVSDPVGNKFVQSLSRPGGNVTGFSLYSYEIVGKWLQLLKEITPQLERVMLLMNVNNPNWPGWFSASEKIFRALKVQLVTTRITSAPDVERQISALARQPNSGLIVLPDPLLGTFERLIIDSAAKNRLPAMYGVERYVDDGGLISYSADNIDLARRAAEYVSRILRGEKPNDLPVQMPTRFRLVVNLKTARSLGLTIPHSVLLIAGKVIE
ncbi:MAG: ABC transporter substrate-binding protein [Burkholderiaceae bacterium]